MTITSVIDVNFPVPIDLLLASNARSTTSAFEYLTEVEMLSAPNSLWNNPHFFSYLFKKFLCDERLMSSLIPVTTSCWIFKFSVIERKAQHPMYHAEDKPFSFPCTKSLCMYEFPYFSSTIAIVGYPFKHLFHKRGSFLIDFYTIFVSCARSWNYVVADWHTSWSHTEFTFSSQSSFHIFRSIIVLQFRLATENHQEKFLIGIVGECRSVGANLYQYPFIHHVDN